MDQYAVMGHPVAHSLSPMIHQAFAEQFGHQLQYEKVLVPLEQFVESVHHFQAEGGKGANITLPFKPEAYAIADERTLRAKQAGAANVLTFKDNGQIIADNVDGVGLVRDIKTNNDYPLAKKRILLLGAGGAARGTIGPLLIEHPKSLVIANRTVSKAEELANEFTGQAAISACGFEDLANTTFDVVINATSLSLKHEKPLLPESIELTGACCYDMVYNQPDNPFLNFCQQRGAALCLDGLGMLVEQAAESYEIWHGVRPETQDILSKLRQQ